MGRRRSLSNKIKMIKVNWIGHVKTHERFLHTVLEDMEEDTLDSFLCYYYSPATCPLNENPARERELEGDVQPAAANQSSDCQVYDDDGTRVSC
jgi:hypothetical protein